MKRLAKKVTLPDGTTYDSITEMRRHGDLMSRQLAGEIRNLRRQVKYPLTIEGRPIKIRSPRYKNGRECIYTPDFVYEEWRTDDMPEALGMERWHIVVEESKGYHTDTARLRMAVFEAQYGIQIRMTGVQKMRKRRRAA